MSLFKKYAEQEALIENLNIPLKKKLPIILISVFYSLIILAIPATVLGNLYIFNDLRYPVTAMLLFLIFALFHISQIFYYRTITERALKYNYILLINGLIALIICIISFIIILYLGVF